jgi:hypothetical protein
MRKLSAQELKEKFIEAFNESDDFVHLEEDSNPFFINFKDKIYVIFLKNISPAYFKASPDITRVQLPFSNHFAGLQYIDTPFVILGYDVENDTMVCWNPKKVKERLNTKSNVSLYSRESLQENVEIGEFKEGFLSNGEKIVIFNYKDLPTLFDNLDELFKDIDEPKIVSPKPVKVHLQDKLTTITDQVLLEQVESLLKNNKTLKAIEICLEFYEKSYPSMTFRDWSDIIIKLYRKICSENN